MAGCKSFQQGTLCTKNFAKHDELYIRLDSNISLLIKKFLLFCLRKNSEVDSYFMCRPVSAF